MARVFQRPRYIHQARNKLLSLAVASDDLPSIRYTASALHLHPDALPSAELDYRQYAELVSGGSEVDDMLPHYAQQLESYLLDSEVGRLARGATLTRGVAALKIASDFVATHKHHAPRRVFCDEEAVFRLISVCLADESCHRESRESAEARTAARRIIDVQLSAQKVAPGVWASVASSAPFARGISPQAAKFDVWIQAAESLQYRAHPMWVKYCRIWALELQRVRPHIQAMIEKVEAAEPHERHKFTALESAISHTHASCYNYSGVLVCYLEGEMFVLDNSAADYLRTVFTSLRNAEICFLNYRVTGDSDPVNLTYPYRRCIEHIRAMISDPSKARFVARHMHLAYTRWQNVVGESSGRVDCGHAARDTSLKADMVAVFPANTHWYDLVMGFDIPDRARAELFKMYHLLPPPDVDPLLLHNELASKTAKTNKCKPAAIRKFIEFCGAYDMCRFMSKHRKVPKHHVTGDYSWRDSPWAKKCLIGKLSMPPEADWGKVVIRGEFPFDHSGDFHIFDAKDSTRVVANLGKYMDRSRYGELSQTDQNELLSAIFRGPALSTGELMPQWRDRVYKGELTEADVVIAAEAGKAENTKPGKKVRETLSACDTAREILSEVDHALRPLAAQTPGVSIRVDAVRHKRKFQTMANVLSRYSTRTALGTSTDISGWSPNQPRLMFHSWQDYALGTTECPDPKAVRKIWDRLTVFVDRRGTKASAKSPEGNIQGWPATSDTTMHAHILIYWAYELRRRGILSEKESALTLCLIDDAAAVVVLDGSPEEAKAKADRARALLVTMYADLGFVMDEVKSFFSSIKFVYLNELYLDGAQVVHAAKTMMRIDRDHARRFASLPDQIGATMGVAASAANQGADPFMAYWMGLWSSMRLAYSVCPELRELNPYHQAFIALCPAGMNGLGIRPMTALFATGAQDMLTWYLEILHSVHGYGLDYVADAILTQAHGTASAVSAFKTPYSYLVEDHTSVSSRVKQAFREAARAKGMAEPFCSLDEVESDPAYEAAVTAVLRAGCHEAALLEEVSGSMPDAFVDEAMNRVDKSELIAYLLGSQAIGRLRRQVTSSDRRNLLTLVSRVSSYPHTATAAADALAARGSFETAKAMRNQYLGEFCIINHTYPCPFSLLAFSGVVDPESERATRLTTASFSTGRFFTTIGSRSRNLYDSKMDNIGYKGYRSVSSNVSDEARISLYNPVKKKVAQGLAALRWARDSGAHHESLRDLFLTAWAGGVDPRVLMLPGRQVEVSAKRLSLRHSKANHLVMMFPNTQAAARIDAQAVTRYQAGHHHMHDMMAVITALRASTLLEAALQVTSGVNDFCYGFSLREDAKAWLTTPSRREVLADAAVIARVRAFTSIQSPLQASAIAATSYDVMTEVLWTMTNAGARAANKLFQAYAEGGEAGPVAPDVVHMQLQPAEQEVIYSRRPDPRAFLMFSDVRAAPSWTGAVAADDPQKPPAEHPRAATAGLDEHNALTVVGQGLVDTTAVHMAEENPYDAAHLYQAAKGKRVVAFIDEHDDAVERVKLRDSEVRKLVKRAEEVAPRAGRAVAIQTVLSAAGMPGFRVADSNDDITHTVKSFIGQAGAIEGFILKIASALFKLKGSSSEEYSSRTVAGALVTKRAIASVIRAQWRFAAARKELWATEKVKTEGGTPDVTRLNYESTFLRAAAKSLMTTGSLDSSTLFLNISDSVVKSIKNHIGEGDDQDEFLDLVADQELDAPLGSSERDDLWDRINAILVLAAQHADDIHRGAMRAALDSVLDWVDADLGGAYKKRSFTGPHTSSSTAAAPAPSSAPQPAGDTVFNIPRATLGTVEPVADWAAFAPHDLFQWAVDDPAVCATVTSLAGTTDLYDVYASVTDSQATYDAWLSAVHARHPDLAPDYPAVTIYDPPAFYRNPNTEGGDDDWMED